MKGDGEVGGGPGGERGGREEEARRRARKRQELAAARNCRSGASDDHLMCLRMVTTVPCPGRLSRVTLSTNARMTVRPRPDSGSWAIGVCCGVGYLGLWLVPARAASPAPSSATSTWQPTAPRLVTTA